MTSPLRRKLRITRPNTLRWNSLSAVAFVLSATFAIGVPGAVVAQDLPLDEDNPFESSTRVEPGRLDPLEELKRRSAAGRWRQRQQGSPRVARQPAVLERTPIVVPNEDAAAEPKFDPLGDYPRAAPLLEDPLSVTLPALPQAPATQNGYQPATSPSELKKITAILPFYDYEPESDEPCKYLCPRPDGKPCPPPGPDSMVPECPEEVPLSEDVYAGREIAGTIFHWEASNIHYNPLYFEDVALERYGHTHHDVVQPFVSVGKFGAQLAGLPYQMTIDPFCKCIYPLGYYRPGDCAPYKHYQVPLNCEAGLVEAGFLTGMFFLIP